MFTFWQRQYLFRRGSFIVFLRPYRYVLGWCLNFGMDGFLPYPPYATIVYRRCTQSRDASQIHLYKEGPQKGDYAISGYHSNKLQSVNKLRNRHEVGHERERRILYRTVVSILCVLIRYRCSYAKKEDNAIPVTGCGVPYGLWGVEASTFPRQ
jgi:hypothetical protein